MIPFEACKTCLHHLQNQSEIFATTYLQICLSYVKGHPFQFSESKDLPLRATVKQLELQHFVTSLDGETFIQVVPAGRYLIDYPLEGKILHFFCSCVNPNFGD